MDDLHFEAIKALNTCRFPLRCFARRFARDLASKSIDDTLSEKQIVWLKKLCYKYRKQIAKYAPKFDEMAGVDWTLDALDVEAVPAPKPTQVIRHHGRYSQETLEQLYRLRERYGGKIPEHIGDFWKL